MKSSQKNKEAERATMSMTPIIMNYIQQLCPCLMHYYIPNRDRMYANWETTNPNKP